MKLKVAAKAIFYHEGTVLIVADPNGKWDFPGGGIEGDERLEDALQREIQEELGWSDFGRGKLAHVDEWFIEKLDLHVVAVFYRIDLAQPPDEHRLSDEHSKIAWLTPEAVRECDVTLDTIRALEAMGL